MKSLISILTLLMAFSFSAIAAADEESTPSPKQEEHLAGRRVHGLLAGGLSYGELFGLGSRATSIEGGVSLTPARHFGITLGADVELGKTTTGELPLGEVTIFNTFEGVAGRLRIGAGPQLSYFWISRARTNERSPIDAIGVGLRARLSVDLFYFEGDTTTPGSRRGIYLAVAPHVEWLNLSKSAWRANATLGLRF